MVVRVFRAARSLGIGASKNTEELLPFGLQSPSTIHLPKKRPIYMPDFTEVKYFGIGGRGTPYK